MDKDGKLIKHPTDGLTYKIIGLAMEAHSRLGPGLKEEMYQKAMEEMLEGAKMNYEPQRQAEVYFGKRLVGMLFVDILVEESVIVELKALSHPLTNNEIAQVITYLKVAGAGVGLLFNFGRKYLEYKRIFPPKKITEVSERDLRFGVRLDAKSAQKREKKLSSVFIR
jgi:GxxExxY protein